MKKYYRYIFGILVLVVLSAGILTYALRCRKEPPSRYDSIEQPARIYPDYCGTVIPPNISPLNFLVQEDGSCYCVKIYSKEGKPIEISSRSPNIEIPLHPWRKLLDMNRGEDLCFDVFVKTKKGQWHRFLPITNKIARETIDSYLVYRKIHPAHNKWREMGI